MHHIKHSHRWNRGGPALPIRTSLCWNVTCHADEPLFEPLGEGPRQAPCDCSNHDGRVPHCAPGIGVSPCGASTASSVGGGHRRGHRRARPVDARPAERPSDLPPASRYVLSLEEIVATTSLAERRRRRSEGDAAAKELGGVGKSGGDASLKTGQVSLPRGGRKRGLVLWPGPEVLLAVAMISPSSGIVAPHGDDAPSLSLNPPRWCTTATGKLGASTRGLILVHGRNPQGHYVRRSHRPNASCVRAPESRVGRDVVIYAKNGRKVHPSSTVPSCACWRTPPPHRTGTRSQQQATWPTSRLRTNPATASPALTVACGTRR